MHLQIKICIVYLREPTTIQKCPISTSNITDKKLMSLFIKLNVTLQLKRRKEKKRRRKEKNQQIIQQLQDLTISTAYQIPC